MVDPASEKAQRRAESAIGAASIAFELSLLGIIAERLGSIEGMSYAEIYAAMPEDIANIKKATKSGISGITGTANDILSNMASANDEWAERYYRARGVKQAPYFNSKQLSETLSKAKRSAIESLSVYCRSSVVAVGDKEFVSVEEAYRRTVTRAATAMQAGTETLQQVVGESIGQMAKDGLRVMYQSGNTRNLHTAIRTNVMDAYRTAMTEMRQIQGREFGADGVEVSAHALCAPDHQDYQGERYPYKPRQGYDLTWDEAQFRPSRPLVTGANCGHTVFPVILDISSPAYTRAELAELKRLSNEPVEFEGLSGDTLTMSRYEASQYQRKMETNIRKMKENTYLLEKANLPNFAKMERKTQRALSAKYKNISKAMGLTPRMENTRIFVQN